MVLIALATLSALIVVQVGPHVASPAVRTPTPAQPIAAGAAAPQQYPIMEAVAAKIIQKYQTSTCEQLWEEKAEAKNKPKSAAEQKAIAMLRNDPQMRTAFINKVAAPVARLTRDQRPASGQDRMPPRL